MRGPYKGLGHCYPVCGRSSAVERHLAKVDVDGSIPFARSNFLIIIEIGANRTLESGNGRYALILARQPLSGVRIGSWRGRHLSTSMLYWPT